MNKIILTAAVIAVGAAVYVLWSNQANEVVVTETAVPQTAPDPTPQPVPEPEIAQQSEVEAAPETQEIEEAVDQAGETASRAAEAIEEGLRDAGEAAQDMADEAATAIDEAVQSTTDAARDAQGSVADTPVADLSDRSGLTEAEVEETLTVEGFDYDRVIRIIDTSTLSDMNKTLLRTTLGQARSNPDALRQVLERVRDALDM